MNILLDTPLLRTSTLKKEFDNRVLLVFMLIIYILVFLGLFLVSLTKEFSNTSPVETKGPQNSPKITRYA